MCKGFCVSVDVNPSRGLAFMDVIALLLGAVGAFAAFFNLVPELGTVGTVVGGFLILAGALLAFARSRVEARGKKTLAQEISAERIRTRINMNGRLQGAVRLVQGMAASNQAARATDLPKVQTAIVSYALGLVKAPQPRATYFRIVLGSSPRRMEPLFADSTDRTDETTTVFTEGIGDDQGVWAIVDGGEAAFERDEERPGKPYRTYISVGVLAGSVPVGMLTINALEPGDLDETDVAMMNVLARILGTAEALGLGTTGLNRARSSLTNPTN